MVLQPNLLFADVYLFNVIDQFLFQPVAIIILLPDLFFQQLFNAFTDLHLPQRLEFGHFFLVTEDIIDAQEQVFFQRCPFIETMGIEVFYGREDNLFELFPLSVRQCITGRCNDLR